MSTKGSLALIFCVCVYVREGSKDGPDINQKIGPGALLLTSIQTTSRGRRV